MVIRQVFGHCEEHLHLLQGPKHKPPFFLFFWDQNYVMMGVELLSCPASIAEVP